MTPLLDVGFLIPKLPVDLRHVCDLIEFEGPLVSEFRDPTGEPYIFYWCDRDARYHRWLIVRTPRADLVRYKAGARTLRQLLREGPDGSVFVCDKDGGGNTARVFFATVDILPETYFPTLDDRDDEEVQEAADRQSVLINRGDDYGDILSELPRKYMQAYAFVGLFGLTSGGVAPKRPDSLDFDFHGGWAYKNFFQKLRKKKYGARGRIAEMAVASPGYMTFAVKPRIADELRLRVESYIKGGERLRARVKALTIWNNAKPHRRIDDDGRKLIREIGDTLRVDIDALLNRTTEVEQVGRILASFVRRIKALANYHVRKEGLLVGMQLDPLDEAAFRATVRRRTKDDDDDDD